MPRAAALSSRLNFANARARSEMSVATTWRVREKVHRLHAHADAEVECAGHRLARCELREQRRRGPDADDVVAAQRLVSPELHAAEVGRDPHLDAAVHALARVGPHVDERRHELVGELLGASLAGRIHCRLAPHTREAFDEACREQRVECRHVARLDGLGKHEQADERGERVVRLTRQGERSGLEQVAVQRIRRLSTEARLDAVNGEAHLRERHRERAEECLVGAVWGVARVIEREGLRDGVRSWEIRAGMARVGSHLSIMRMRTDTRARLPGCGVAQLRERLDRADAHLDVVRRGGEDHLVGTRPLDEPVDAVRHHLGCPNQLGSGGRVVQRAVLHACGVRRRPSGVRTRVGLPKRIWCIAARLGRARRVASSTVSAAIADTDTMKCGSARTGDGTKCAR